MKKFVLAIIVLGLFSSLISCSAGISATEAPYLPTRSPKPDWLVQWLNEPTCQPPCWENIIPGTTSFVNAQIIAQKISGFKIEVVDIDSIRLNAKQHGVNYIVNILSEGQENVQVIYMDISYTFLELGEIVDIYGFPDEMRYITEFDRHFVDLLYYDIGMVITFELLPSEPWHNVNLNSAINVDLISFYAPQLKEYFSTPQQYGTSNSSTIKLNGYGDYNIPEGGNSP